jgi:hypothetical protein
MTGDGLRCFFFVRESLCCLDRAADSLPTPG